MQASYQNIKHLTDSEATSRLSLYGPNELPGSKNRRGLKILLDVVREPMIFFLLVCAGLYFFLGDKTEAFFLLGSVGVIVGINLFQQSKTEKAIQALKDLSSPMALVVRNGAIKRIPGREVVLGDLVILKEGDRVPADGLLLDENNLLIDESLLTGESLPVSKYPAQKKPQTESATKPDHVYAGTMVIRGEGAACIEKTGKKTEMGKIGLSLSDISEGKTRLQNETVRLVRVLGVVGILLCVIIFIGYGIIKQNYLQGALAGLTMAMSLLPEEFPVVLTVFLALGAWRMSQKKVLTRKIPALEDLGAITVLCVDKTGTLTQNKMTLRYLDSSLGVSDLKEKKEILTEEEKFILENSFLANQKNPVDPMEKAIVEAASGYFKEKDSNLERMREYPLESSLPAMSCVWKNKGTSELFVSCKGAPETVFKLCRFSDEEQKFWAQKMDALASLGVRVLGVAHAVLKNPEKMPESQKDFAFRFLGLLGFEDPVRPEVPQAIAECKNAGIRVLMITGDSPQTARHVAQEIGLAHSDSAIRGEELFGLGSKEIYEKLSRVSVVARSVPENKLQIVRALKEAGEVVAMTGDGVNDGPSLKAADIGVGMGQKGTDVAREASDLVLMDDNFASIVKAIRLGRTIFGNITKAFTYLLAIHVPIALVALLPLLFGFPLPLFPLHIVFLEMIIDPASSLVFEGEEAEEAEEGIMKKPPRPSSQKIFSNKKISISFLQGLLSSVFILFSYYYFYKNGDEPLARTAGFVTLVTANLGLVFVNSSKTGSFWKHFLKTNKAFGIIILMVSGFLFLVLSVPWFYPLFGFERISIFTLAFSLFLGSLPLILFGLIRSFFHVFMRQRISFKK